MVTGDVLVRTFDPDLETEQSVIQFLGQAIDEGEFIDFETGRFMVAQAHIVTVEVSGLTASF